MSGSANAPGGAGLSSARGRRRLAAAVAVVLVLAAALVAILLATRPGSPPAGGATPALPELRPGPMNILVIGSDIRGSAREALQGQAVSGGATDQNADMIMLIHLPADRRRIYGISIMRDSWVPVPGHGDSKINASLASGGPQLVVDTVGGLLKTTIDHYVLTDFDGFKALTDALGGVEVDVTVPFTADFDTHHTFTPGINRLDGQAALEFVRARYVFPDGDFQRVRNQQTFVRSVIAQVLGTGKVRDPGSAIGIIGALSPHLVVDKAFDPMTMAALGYALRDVDPASSVFFTLPTSGTGTSPDGQSIVLPDFAGISEVSAALAADALADYAAAHGM